MTAERDNMLCWPLHGVGLDNLGFQGAPCVWPIPKPQAGELLVRIDAVGLCFSDIKLIRAGEEHPRVHSENLSKNPVIPGHEAVMTVVEAGSEELASEYPPGTRYIIQADIYVNGVGYAYGYAINGAMAQYSIIDQRVLNGDEGSYLLPLADHVPAAIAALIEPWTCVIASYMIEPRTRVKSAGKMLAAMEPEHQHTYSFTGEALAENGAPALVECLNLNPATLDNLRAAMPKAEFRLLNEVSEAEETTYDDIVLCGIKDQGLAVKLSRLGEKGAVISFVGPGFRGECSFDVGSIHYRDWFYQGTETAQIDQAYGRNVRSQLCSGGSCWLVGGAGAMGQMHTQLAIENEEGPSRILVTDLDQERLARVEKFMLPEARKRGKEIKTLNPKDFPSEREFLNAVKEFSPAGFDDIVMLVPAVPVINSAVPHLAENGVMNIFAGIPAGKEAVLDVGAIVSRGARYIGSSGSRTHHLRHTLNLVETGQLRPVTALAALGGMRSLKKGLQGVAEGHFPGKTVIFPQCENMPLVSVEQLPSLDENIEEALGKDHGAYEHHTEKAILEKYDRDCQAD